MNIQRKKIVIFGFGVAGKDVLRSIKKTKKTNFEVLGFLDDDKQKISSEFLEVRVLGGRDLIPRLAKRIDEVIIAMPSAFGESISEIVKACSENNLKFKIVPRVREIIEGRVRIQTIREVKVEDLLGRPVVKTDVRELKKFFSKKRVLISGAAGSIGSELTRQIAAYRPQQITALDWWENGIFNLQAELTKNFPNVKIVYAIGNIQDKKRVESILTSHKPHFVFHAAAYKHVPVMEENVEEAVKNNILGTYNLASISKKLNVEKFVLVSTDKAANPKSIMGTTKFLAEQILQNLKGKTKFITVRFGNVLDSNGSVIPTFRQQIQNGGPITLTDKRMTRYFMTIPEAAHLILNSANIGMNRDVFLLDMGSPVKIYDLARNLIRLSGFSLKEIPIEYMGVRKGEKLHEQLYSDNEELTKSGKEKIYKVYKKNAHPIKMTVIQKLIKNAIMCKTETVKNSLKEFTKII